MKKALLEKTYKYESRMKEAYDTDKFSKKFSNAKSKFNVLIELIEELELSKEYEEFKKSRS